MTLEEIENVSGFIGRLEKIELPNQLVAIMGDPLLQKLLQLKSTDITRRRVDNWLMAFFEDQLENEENSEAPLLDMLASIREYIRFTKVSAQTTTTLRPIMLIVNEGASTCLRKISTLFARRLEWRYRTRGCSRPSFIYPNCSIRRYLAVLYCGNLMLILLDLYSSTFRPLEWDILDGTPKSQIDILTFYTCLLRNWTVDLLSSPPPSFAGAAIDSLTTHANTLSLTILQTSSVQTISTHDSVLAFYETTASLLSLPTLQPHIRITTPPSALIYTLYFTPSLSTLSRLCAILALYKRAFETAMSKPVPPSADPSQPAVEAYPKDYVNHFNGFLMDICNCLWRSRAFNTSDTNALGCLLPPPLLPKLTSYISSLDTGLSLQSLFSLSYAPVLCNLSISYLRELEDKAEEEAEGTIRIRHAGPVTQKSLVALGKEGGLQLGWPAYRLGVLTYLEGKGVKGVGELMYNTMKHLMTARENAAKA